VASPSPLDEPPRETAACAMGGPEGEVRDEDSVPIRPRFYNRAKRKPLEFAELNLPRFA
jgi:hypothetical protein